MTNEEILKQAIDKALSNGWDMFGFAGKLVSWNVNPSEHSYQTWLWGRMSQVSIYQLQASLNDTLFSHNFAKAFWGEHKVCSICGTSPKLTGRSGCPDCNVGEWSPDAWQYHLQQMVLEEDPIKYLEAFL